MERQLSARLLRKRKDFRQASFLELFFDLAFIVTLMALSTRLVRNLGWLDVAETVVLLAAAWWVWAATAWSTDWYNPNEPIIRIVVLGTMFLGLLMAAAIPEAYDGHGLFFAGTFVTVHLGRAVLLVPALRGHVAQRRSLLAALWYAVSAIPWLVGAFASGHTRLLLWVLAVVVNYASPLWGWGMPRLGRVPSAQFRVVGEHLSERYRQIFIVALGHIFLVSGASYASVGVGFLPTAALAVAFLNAGLLLWMYFVPASGQLGSTIDQIEPLGAVVAGYCHLTMIAGIVLTAVGAELMIGHPLHDSRPAWSASVVGGAALFLAGRILLGLRVYGQRAWLSIIGLAVLLAGSPGLVMLPPLAAGIVTNLVLLVVVLSYTLGAEARRARAEERRVERRQAEDRQPEQR